MIVPPWHSRWANVYASFLSYNNAGINSALVGGVIASKYDRYQIDDQWTSYGWNVFALEHGNNYDPNPTPPLELRCGPAKAGRGGVRRTVKGYWPGAVDGKIPGYGDQLVSYPSHPYAMRIEFGVFLPPGLDV